MSAACCGHHHEEPRPETNAAYRRVLWAVLAINASMFAVEIGAGLHAGSASLQADALDFLGDAANYGISLFVVGMSLRHRAGAALAKERFDGSFRSLGVGGCDLAPLFRHPARSDHDGRDRRCGSGG